MKKGARELHCLAADCLPHLGGPQSLMEMPRRDVDEFGHATGAYAAATTRHGNNDMG